jgi:uncharacterized protein
MQSQPRASMMICPVCTIELVVIEKQGIEIDYCPQCRGVWLDRGELVKLIERSLKSPYDERNDRNRGAYRDEYRDRAYDREHQEDRYRNEHGERGYRGGHHGDKHRRGSF